MPPRTRYAKSGSVNIAYQVVGEGPIDLVMVPGFVSHVEVSWERPKLAHLLTRLGSFARLIVFDKRGTGMSDPASSAPTMDERMDDIRAVMDAAGSERAALFGVSEGGSLSLLFALHHAERARALILYGSWARRMTAPDYPWGIEAPQLEKLLATMGEAWDTGEWWGDPEHPSPFDDERHRAWWARYLRMAASPSMAQQVIRMNVEIDLREQLADVRTPTLILHRSGDLWIQVGHARFMAERIPGARYVELPGEDHRPWLGDVDAILEEIEVFLDRQGQPAASSKRHGDRLLEQAGARGRITRIARPNRPPDCGAPGHQRTHRRDTPREHLRQARCRLEGGSSSRTRRPSVCEPKTRTSTEVATPASFLRSPA